MTLRITDQAYATDTGRQRSANEDSVFVRAPVFVIADGMGGAQAGEVASKTSAESFDRALPAGPPERVLKQTIEGALGATTCLWVSSTPLPVMTKSLSL